MRPATSPSPRLPPRLLPLSSAVCVCVCCVRACVFSWSDLSVLLCTFNMTFSVQERARFVALAFLRLVCGWCWCWWCGAWFGD